VRYLHTMVRVSDLDESLDFYCNKLGLKETRRIDHEEYREGRNFGHVAFEVDDIYRSCASLQAAGVTINRPPRDGKMAFVRSPDNISIELLQKGKALEPEEPWASMPNVGKW
jgi:lactoylglutathione lyase